MACLLVAWWSFKISIEWFSACWSNGLTREPKPSVTTLTSSIPRRSKISRDQYNLQKFTIFNEDSFPMLFREKIFSGKSHNRKILGGFSEWFFSYHLATDADFLAAQNMLSFGWLCRLGHRFNRLSRITLREIEPLIDLRDSAPMFATRFLEALRKIPI